MDKIKVLVVEDEFIISNNICDSLTTLGYKFLEPVFSYTEAMAAIDIELPDVAILDIQLSGKKTGIDLAKKIRELYNFPFIFLTSNTDKLTIDLVKEVNPPAYLVKPFTQEELYSAIEIVMHNHISIKDDFNAVIDPNKVIKDALFIKSKGCTIKLQFKDILYVRSAHIYLEIIMRDNKKHLTRTSLHNILKNLDTNFIRVHRGFIINTKYLSEIKQSSLKIRDEDIPIGRKYKKEILQRVKVV